ncbi:metallophosphoesterase [Desulforamulus reducens MI-1]|uniref:Metallophosphoesterase n=1 Tax=Desulforamulus reducens (strain ATCC BAA-1160 / DSM 100696 / MI-1) TaxID=349161 RepID=A4J2I1_DESRM|nr:metallophosphoesterase [Desulforamulus reducens]ABO49284.1 metallophosphoesterase [Desulforamulus reducens MI-1]
MRIWFSVILIFYAVLNWLIGRQIYDLLKINKFAYWPIFVIIAISPLLGRLSLISILDKLGNYWLIFFYFATFVAILGIFIKNKPFFIGCYLLIFLAIFYGALHAKSIKVEPYNLAIPKKANDLRVVMLSDIHIDKQKSAGYVAKMVQDINALNPDMVFLPGDIFDDRDINSLKKEQETLKGIKTKYGVYGVLGNHEYYGGNLSESLAIFKEVNIQILRDEVIEVAGVYIVGREDASQKSRKGLVEILQNVDKTKPIILLDHQPVALDEAQNNGVDLQLSGHTHRGQFFPNQLITKRIYEVDYGYLAKDNLQVIVSSGYGTWGPPVRIGTQSEIIDLKINFDK